MASFFKSLFKGKEENLESGNGKENKKSFDIFKYDGMRAQRMGRTDYAVKCYLNALEIEEDFEVMNWLSQIYIHQDEMGEAIILLKKMIESEPEFLQTYLTLSNVYYFQELYTQMAEVLDKAITIDTENATTHYLQAKAQIGLKEEENAVTNLTKAISLKDNYMEAYLLRAEVLTEMKQYNDALNDVDFVLQHHADEESGLLLHGKLQEAIGNSEQAEADYRKATNLNPFNEHAYINLGQLYISQKKLSEAIELFDEAIELNPNSASAYHERGRAKLLNGDKNGSTEDLKKSLELNSKDMQPVNAQFEAKKEEFSNSLGLPI